MSDVDGEKVKGKQGFASMSKNKARKIQAKGGRTSHINGNAHTWDADEAREAGKKGRVRNPRASHQGELTDFTYFHCIDCGRPVIKDGIQCAMCKLGNTDNYRE